MDMDRNPYLKLMKIDNKTLTKMKYMLNKDDVWVSKNQVRVHTRKKKKHGDAKEEQETSSDDEIEVPTSCKGDDIQIFINSSANKSISRERGLGNDLSTFDIDIIF
jgi:hypothetical protein